MRGTDHALLDQLGRLIGGVAVLRPQGSSATLPDLPSQFCLRPSGAFHRRYWFGYQDIPGQAPKNSTIPFRKVGGSGKTIEFG